MELPHVFLCRLFIRFVHLKMLKCCSFLLIIIVNTIFCTEVLRPRGVPLSKKVFYDPSRDFNCLDGSAIVPFNFVNDDYCDCIDGSDEPGTAACSNGIFYCPNAGHIPQNIPSSRVNDGICDCCDASDEYNSTAECINNCREMGQRSREEAQRQQELYTKGYEVRQQMIKDAKQKKIEFREKLEQLKLEESEAGQMKEVKEVAKREAEEREKVVLDKYKSVEEERKQEEEEFEMQKHQEEDKLNARQAFLELDSSQDEVLNFKELQDFPMFDSNKDGIVSEDEAKFFLHMKDEMELEEFLTTGWMIMKPIYMMNKMQTSTPSPDDVLPPPMEDDIADPLDETEPPISDDEADDRHDDDPTEDEDLPSPPKFPDAESTVEKKEETKYDEESQQIIEAARVAREAHTEADQNLQKIINDIKDLEQSLEMDFGPEEEFIILKDQCFEFSDREYTYKFCPFDRAVQIPKSGGGEVSLGRGGKWIGADHEKYSQMKLEGGMVCWNGPARSAVVNLHCGLEHALTGASEPNRCEYHLEFNTPLLCSTPQSAMNEEHIHEEL